MSAGMEKGIKYRQDQSSIMLLFEHNFRYNAAVSRMTLKSMLKFSSIMYLILPQRHSEGRGPGIFPAYFCKKVEEK